MDNSEFRYDMLKNMAFNEDDPIILAQLRGYKEFTTLYESAIREIRTKITNLEEEFAYRFDHKPIHHVETRLKDSMSIVKKLTRRNIDVSMENAIKHLDDIAGIRIVCPYADDVYLVSELLLAQEGIRLIRQNDYIRKPKENGYRSVHIVVEVPIFTTVGRKDIRVEIQLRTIAMDFWASLEHDIRYKRMENENREDLLLRLKLVAQKIHTLDKEMMQIFHDSRFIDEN